LNTHDVCKNSILFYDKGVYGFKTIYFLFYFLDQTFYLDKPIKHHKLLYPPLSLDNMADSIETKQEDTQLLPHQPIQQCELYKPLKFHFCRGPANRLPWSQNEYPEMDIRLISENDVSSNHEFYEEFMELFQQTPDVYVPSTFPKINSFHDVLLATNIIYPNDLQNSRIRIIVDRNIRRIQNLSDPSQCTIVEYLNQIPQTPQIPMKITFNTLNTILP
jgi:hypothetical protein